MMNEKLPNTPSKSVRALNPHLWPEMDKQEKAATDQKRVKQSSKPLTQLEREWFLKITLEAGTFERPVAQALTFRLANGLRYTPDFFSWHWPAGPGHGNPTAWEVKGKHAWDDAIAKVKMFAATYPMIKVWLVWKSEATGAWCQQEILPDINATYASLPPRTAGPACPDKRKTLRTGPAQGAAGRAISEADQAATGKPPLLAGTQGGDRKADP